MASFAGFVVATLVAWVVNDALDPYGVPPLKLMAAFLVWMMCFYFVRRALADLRPDV